MIPNEARILVIIVNYKSARLTEKCIASLQEERRHVPQLRVVVVENDSGDEAELRRTLETERLKPWVQLVMNRKNGGFAYGNNRGLEYGDSLEDAPQYYLMLNPDTVVHPGAVRTLADFMDKFASVGIAGSSFQNEDGEDWPFAFRFPNVLSEIDGALNLGLISKLLKEHRVSRVMPKQPAPVDWVAGACFMVRREVFESVGSMDEQFFLYFEETDFCQAVQRAGWGCWYVPESRVTHIAGQSTGVTVRNQKPKRRPGYWFESRRRYFLKNYGLYYAMLNDMTHAAAFSLGHVKRTLQRRRDTVPPNYLRDLLRHSPILKRNRNLQPAIEYRPRKVKGSRSTPFE